MEKVFIFLIAMSFLTCCSESEKSLDDEMKLLEAPIQIFTIKNNKADTLITQKGVTLIIPPGTFEFFDGSMPSDSIDFQITEVFNKSEMIARRIGTLANGKLLESSGMVQLNVSSNGKELRIKSPLSINVISPNLRQATEGELFYGQENNNFIEWTYAGNNDTTVVIETIIPVEEGTHIKKSTYLYINGIKQLISVDSTFVQYSGNGDYKKYLPNEVENQFSFQINKLGWINCDRFIEITDKSNLELKPNNYHNPLGYIVLNDINSVLPIHFDQNGSAILYDLPTNDKVQIVVIDKIKSNIVWTKRPYRIGSTHRLSLNLEKIDINKLKKELRQLNN